MTPFLAPPVGRRSTVCPSQAKTKTFLRKENQQTFATSACLPLVGPAALKLSQRRLSIPPHLASVQAHPSMRICLWYPIAYSVAGSLEGTSGPPPCHYGGVAGDYVKCP